MPLVHHDGRVHDGQSQTVAFTVASAVRTALERPWQEGQVGGRHRGPVLLPPRNTYPLRRPAPRPSVFGVRRLPLRDRMSWWCFAFGILSNVTGIGVGIYSEDVLGWIDLPTPSDTFFLALSRRARSGWAC